MTASDWLILTHEVLPLRCGLSYETLAIMLVAAEVQSVLPLVDAPVSGILNAQVRISILKGTSADATNP